MILMSVDLPEPFSPTRECTSPRPSLRLTPCRAWTPANHLWTSLNAMMMVSGIPTPPKRAAAECSNSKGRASLHGDARPDGVSRLEWVLVHVFRRGLDPALPVEDLAH